MYLKQTMYNAASLLYLQTVLHVILFRMSNIFCIFFFYITTFVNMYAVPNMAVCALLLLLLLLLLKTAKYRMSICSLSAITLWVIS